MFEGSGKGRSFGKEEGRSFSDKHLDIGREYMQIEPMALKNKIRLKSAELAPGIGQIGIQSFAGCTSMHTVHFGNLERIQREAFDGCVNLKQLRIPNTVRMIGEGGFRNCKRLETLLFQQSSRMTVIKKEAFSGCAELRNLKLPWKLERIEDRAFYRCLSLEQLKLPQYLKSIGKEAFYFNHLKTLEIPPGLQILGDSAFFKSMCLEYVFIPESVRYIGKWVFHGSNRLKVLEIHHDPEFLGDWITNKITVIRCKRGSRMEEYCKRFGMEAELI